MWTHAIIENAEELIAPSADLKWYYYIPWMFINKYMCYGLNIALNWIDCSLYSVTTPFMLTFYGSVDNQEASWVSSFSFVVVYLTLIVPDVLIVS